MIKHVLIVILVSIATHTLTGQGGNGGWPVIPGFGPESPLTLTDRETFLVVAGAGGLSYVLSELVGDDQEDVRFYQVRLGANREHFWGYRHVYSESAGIESRLSHWFGVALEFNLQQWQDNTPTLSQPESGVGLGLMSYVRWYAFGRQRISPYLEYGLGGFSGFGRFPAQGTKLSFNHSTQIGLEWTFSNHDRLRLGYGQFHQSSHGLSSPDPGHDGEGFSLSYSWHWQ